MKIFRNLIWLVAVIGTVAGSPPQARCNDLNPGEPVIIRIEEDWIAYIRNPDPTVGAPQILNVISPTESTSGVFGMVELNHSSRPEFRSGGFQVQSWVADVPVAQGFSDHSIKLDHEYDKLSYTVAMQLEGNLLRFELKDGRSRTWGRFAEDGVIAYVASGGIDFTDYNPEFSVANTNINVGAHRVEVLYMTEARYYSATGLEETDKTNRVIHRYRDRVQFVSLDEYDQHHDEYNIDINE